MKHIALLLACVLSCIHAFAQVFSVTSDKSWKFPIESVISISYDSDTLFDVNDLVDPSTIVPEEKSYENYYSDLAVLVIHSDDSQDTVFLNKVSDFTFAAKYSNLNVGDEILMLYKRNTDKWWVLQAKTNKYKDYNLYSSNSFTMGSVKGTRYKVVKEINTTFAQNTSDVYFVVTANTMNTTKLNVIGYSETPTRTDTIVVGTTFKTKYSVNNPVFQYATGNTLRSKDMTLVSDSVWSVTFNPSKTSGTSFLFSYNNVYSRCKIVTDDPCGVISVTDSTCSPFKWITDDITVFLNENTMQYAVMGYKTPVVSKIEDLSGKCFGVDKSSFYFDFSTKKFVINGSAYRDIEISSDFTINGDTVIVVPAHKASTKGREVCMIYGSMGDDTYISTSFLLSESDQFLSRLSPIKFVYDGVSLNAITDFQIYEYWLPRDNATYYTQLTNEICKSGTKFYVK